MLTGLERAEDLPSQAAADVAAWNQLGCLSPHVIYVEHGGGVPPEQFAGMLAEELERREDAEPRGELPVEAGGGHRVAPRLLRGARRPFARHPPLVQPQFDGLDGGL